MDLTRKVGPLPMWGWGAGLLGAAIAYSFVTRGKSSKTSDSSASTTTDDTVPADQVPSYINQTYVTTNTTVNDTDDTTPAAPPGAGHPPVGPPPRSAKPVLPSKPTPGKPKATSYKVKHGDTLSSIAKKNGTTWQKLWAFNTATGNRPADTIKTLKQRGPNLLFAGETILIPSK